MAIVEVAMQNQNGNHFMDKQEGEIYKGFGIVLTLSAGRMAGFAIHIPTGRIIASLVDGFGSEAVKVRIDQVTSFINGEMTYEEIDRILHSPMKFQKQANPQKQIWMEVEGTYLNGFAVIQNEQGLYEVLDIQSKKVLHPLTADSLENARMNLYSVEHLIYPGMSYGAIMRKVQDYVKKNPKHILSSDATMNSALKEEVTSLRGSMVQQAEKTKLPSRFSTKPHPDTPSMFIYDKETGKETLVPLFAYGEVLKALKDLFE
jgi:hypothetical protein